MKKSILLFVLSLMSTIVLSQNVRYYARFDSILAMQFHGTQECYDSIISRTNPVVPVTFKPNYFGAGVHGIQVDETVVDSGHWVVTNINESTTLWKTNEEFWFRNRANKEEVVMTPEERHLYVTIDMAEDTSAIIRGLINNKMNSSAFTWSNLSGKPALATVSSTGDYNDLSNKPIIPANTNQLTNGSGFITSEIDGSITNEIELPTQSGNGGKYLTTNGSSTTWSDLNFPTVYKYNSGSAPQTIESKIFVATAITNSSGIATIYVTDNGAANGNALFSNIYVKLATAENNTGTLTSVPLGSIKQVSNGKTIEINVVESVGILIGGQGLEFSPAGIVVNLTIIGD